jgi:chromosome segregation ATPase
MNWKKFVIWLSVFLMFFALLTVSGFVIYFNRPNWLGIKNALADSLNMVDSIENLREAERERIEQLYRDTVRRPPVPLKGMDLDSLIEVSPEQINYFEKELYSKSEELKTLGQRQSNLQAQYKILQDTIKQLKARIANLTDTLKQAGTKITQADKNTAQNNAKLASEQKKLAEANKKYTDLESKIKSNDAEVAKMRDEMKKVLAADDKMKKEHKSLLTDVANAKRETDAQKKKYDSLQKAYKALEEKYEKKKDSLRIEGYKKFANLYNTADAKDVAKILESLEPNYAANILARMQKKKAGKVIEAMDPIKSASILKEVVDN